MRILTVATAALLLVSVGCSGDPNDPRTWGKKLGDLREQKEALDRIASMDVEKARVVVPELLALYKDSKKPEHLEALARYKDDRTKAVMIEALDYSEDDFDRATVAAGVLGEMKATDAVDPLMKALDKQLPVKSRANTTRLAALRALVKIGDKRAVPLLAKILTTSADEQDFLLNQKAALGLAELHDPSSVPALLQGLFIAGRGIDTFQECRLALVRVGDPAVDPIIQMMQGKNQDIQALAKKLSFRPGIVVHKAAWLLGDLRAKKAVPALLAQLSRPQESEEHATIMVALGQIGLGPAVEALLGAVKNAKLPPGLRASAANGLSYTGDKRAVPALLDVAKNGYVKAPDGTKASDLRASAVVDLSRIAGKEDYEAIKTLVDKETEAQGIFGEALDRMSVAKACGSDVACYGKALSDPSWTRAEKAAFSLGYLGDAKAIPMLLDALKPVATLSQDRYLVQQAILYSLTRLGTKSCAACADKLEKQIERDEKAVRIPGARNLLAETRVTLALIQNKS